MLPPKEVGHFFFILPSAAAISDFFSWHHDIRDEIPNLRPRLELSSLPINILLPVCCTTINSCSCKMHIHGIVVLVDVEMGPSDTYDTDYKV